jgi:hypothetical protein
MFYSSIPTPPSLSLSSPYSKNAGAEFVSKIDLATVGLQYTHVHDVHTATVCARMSQTTQYTTIQWQSARHCNAYVGCVHQMHTNVLLNRLQNQPNHFLINTMM